MEFNWKLPQSALLVTNDGKEEIKLNTKNGSKILSFDNIVVGELINLNCFTKAYSDYVSIDIFIPHVNKNDYQVITSGWHTWSGRDTRGKDVGIGDFQSKLSKDFTEFVVEPGAGKVPIPSEEGVSYGFLAFRKHGGLDNIGVGVIPSLKEIENIKFKLKDGGVVVTITKNLEKLNHDREVVFNLFLANGKYSEIISRFGEELSKLNHLKLMKNRIIWFSWAAYGKGVNQLKDIEPELRYIKEVGADSVIIDDGWQKVVGQWEVDIEKFPDIIKMISAMKDLGIKPGVWIAPFMVMRESEIFKLKNEWIIKDKKGNPVKVSNPQIQPTGKLRPFVERAVGLDISITEVREYLYQEFIRLAKIGFEIFKVDFISIPFVSELSNKEKTSVEYYREFFIELRKRINNATGKNIEFIGCGGPMMESVGLFDGIRVSADSAWPNISTLYYYGKLFNFFSSVPLIGRVLNSKVENINTIMYKDAAAVAFRRALLFGKSFGLFVDGIHLNDPDIKIDKLEKKRVAEALPAFKWLGVLNNLFIGDSLVRSGIEGRLEWKEFISKYKKGEEAWIDEETGNVLIKE